MSILETSKDQLGFGLWKDRIASSSHEVGAVDVGNLAKASVVKVPGVSGSTADENLGLEEVGVLLESIVVDQASGGVNLVRERLEVDGGSRDVALGGEGTVGTVAARGQR